MALALASGKQGEVYSWTLAPSEAQASLEGGYSFSFSYLFSKDLLASVDADLLGPLVISSSEIFPELKLHGHMIHCPLRALRYFLDRTNAWRKGKISFSCLFSKNQLASDGPDCSNQWSFQLSNHS